MQRRKTVGRQLLLYVVLSAILLVPLFWHSRIQAGDLSSHIYNSWLAQLAEQGEAPALQVVTQSSNVLFDLLLYRLFREFGPDAAQRIAVAIAVLIFGWGAFAFVRVVSGRSPWFLWPCVAMLTYGWAFHMGLFNFYLALGISWWALALLWQGGIVRWLLATPLLVIAFVGHPLPPLWAVAIGGYILISRRLPRERQTLLMGVAVGLLLALHVVVRFAIDSEWLPQQMSLITGVNQVYLFGGSFAVVPALAAVWLMLLGRRLFTEPWRDVLLSLPMQLVMLSAVAVAAIPQRIDLLAYIAHRASLLVAVLVCAVLAGARMRWWERAGPSLVAILFFTLLYFNTRTGNALDDRVHAVVETLPPGSRVIGIGNLTHLVDRACIGRCYSYANYEPSTGAFRVRVRGRNSIVVDDFGVSQHMQAGTYEPQPGDPSWYQLKHCDTGLCVAEISAKPGP